MPWPRTKAPLRRRSAERMVSASNSGRIGMSWRKVRVSLSSGRMAPVPPGSPAARRFRMEKNGSAGRAKRMLLMFIPPITFSMTFRASSSRFHSRRASRPPIRGAPLSQSPCAVSLLSYFSKSRFIPVQAPCVCHQEACRSRPAPAQDSSRSGLAESPLC